MLFTLQIQLDPQGVYRPEEVALVLAEVASTLRTEGAPHGDIAVEGSKIGSYAFIDAHSRTDWGGDVRSTDPESSRINAERDHRPPDDELMARIWERWNDRLGGGPTDGTFTDDDVLNWIGFERGRNVAAKVRGHLEEQGLVARVTNVNGDLILVENDKGSKVMCFRPVGRL